MSKRFAPNHNYGGYKKAKLDVSLSDHRLPLSQNSNKENDFDAWGDENDDVFLLQASQAAEQEISSDTSMLPDYSAWEPPGASTQHQPAPSTSKAAFTFKKPSGNPPSAISTHLKNKCSTISSPLPGMASKFIPDKNGYANITEDLVINSKALPGRDNFAYNELLQLKEENEKLMADNDKLQQRCVTKEGEASILRTQLKSFQAAVDSARMEKARVQDDVKKEFKTKIETYESQKADLQTQLEFQNLEIIRYKEKCKNLESGKRMTQVIVPNHDTTSSYRNNVSVPFDAYNARRPHTSSSAQTEDNTPFVKLKKTRRKDGSSIPDIQDYNDNLQNRVASSNNSGYTSGSRRRLSVSSITDDLVQMMTAEGFRNSQESCYLHLFSSVFAALGEVRARLQDERCGDAEPRAAGDCLQISLKQLCSGEPLYSSERGRSPRRLLAAAAGALEHDDGATLFLQFQEDTDTSFVDTAVEICELIERRGQGLEFSGMLVSLSLAADAGLASASVASVGAARVLRAAVAARAAPAAHTTLLRLARRVHATDLLEVLCGGSRRMDRDDSCHLQLLLEQVTTALQSIEKQRLEHQASVAMGQLTSLSRGLATQYRALPAGNRCECEVKLGEALVYSLRVCARMLEKKYKVNNRIDHQLMSRCQSCVCALYQLAPLEALAGALADAADALRRLRPVPELENMLNELTCTFQLPMEETPSYLQAPWHASFDDITMAD